MSIWDVPLIACVSFSLVVVGVAILGILLSRSRPRLREASLVRELAELRQDAIRPTPVVIGPEGTGKSYLALALSDRYCSDGQNRRLTREERLLAALCLHDPDDQSDELSTELPISPAIVAAGGHASGLAEALEAVLKRASDEVCCCVFAPQRLCREEPSILYVFLYRLRVENQIARLAKSFDRYASLRGRIRLTTQVVRESKLSLQLATTGADVEEPLQQCTWRGKTEVLTFAITNIDPQARHVVAKLTLLNDGVPVGHIYFKFELRRRRQPLSQPSAAITAKQFKTVFTSYAGVDRAEVLRRVQVLRRRGLTCFQDVLDLDPGERWEQQLYRHIDESDALFLFWSTAASNSEWVGREWAYGLERHGDAFIEPITIEGPPIPEPPEALRHLHFGDPLLYAIRQEDELRQQRHSDRSPPDETTN